MKIIGTLYKVIVFFLFFLYHAPGVGAHSFSITSVTTNLAVEGSSIKMETVVPLAYTLPSDVSDEEKLKINTQTTEYISENFFVIQELSPCTLQIIDSFPKKDDIANTVLQSEFVCEKPIQDIQKLTFKSTLFQELSTESWSHFIFLKYNGTQTDIVLSREKNVYPQTVIAKEIAKEWGLDNVEGHTEDPSYSDSTDGDAKALSNESKPQNMSSLPPSLEVIKEFVVVGIEHILIGTDHILFVVVLVLLIISVRDILKLTITFTIAHSITLILASLGLIQLTGKIVEPIIALSIIYLALENFFILRKVKQDKKEDEEEKGKKSSLNKRLIITFLFGLFHGLGFAGVLSEVAIPEDYFLTSLLSFNLGVEIGQLFIVFIILLPLLYMIKKYSWREVALQWVSLLISIIAAFWFIERVFL